MDLSTACFRLSASSLTKTHLSDCRQTHRGKVVKNGLIFNISTRFQTPAPENTHLSGFSPLPTRTDRTGAPLQEELEASKLILFEYNSFEPILAHVPSDTIPSSTPRWLFVALLVPASLRDSSSAEPIRTLISLGTILFGRFCSDLGQVKW
ncbi:unnamed protein product [Protopolystoma xenopodis]|uniref:Uncharacterized protein n=1 Tax=Protopolystoma xenopodis TaxID=117903 RepID=A0A3S5ARI3_9PLAT|nr:unnamed protein product [Protopolystoma xenopodis]